MEKIQYISIFRVVSLPALWGHSAGEGTRGHPPWTGQGDAGVSQISDKSPARAPGHHILPLGAVIYLFIHLGFIVSGSLLGWERKWIQQQQEKTR